MSKTVHDAYMYVSVKCDINKEHLSAGRAAWSASDPGGGQTQAGQDAARRKEACPRETREEGSNPELQGR